MRRPSLSSSDTVTPMMLDDRLYARMPLGVPDDSSAAADWSSACSCGASCCTERLASSASARAGPTLEASLPA